MAETVEVRIIASNGASQVFRAIQQDADRLSTSLTDAGRDGDRAFEEIERGAQDAGREMQNAERSARSMGDRIQGAADTIDGMAVGLTALGGALVYSGNQAMENERQIIALEQAYGDAADGMIQFSEELSNSLSRIFTDEDVRRGALYFATLRNEYDLSIEQIEMLMVRTADLAALRGISFEEASSRITAAIRGETEAAEYLNLTLNQQAIDREGITLSMSNQEAAQFRLNAAMEQSAVYQGTAERIAASSVGTYSMVTDRLQDMAVTAGEFIGPWGAMISGLGFGLTGVTSLVGGLGRMTTAMRSSTTVASALSLAMNPLVLGLGAVTAAGIAWYQTLDEGESILDRFESGMDDLVDMDGQGFFENLYGAVMTFATGVDEATFSVRDLESVLDDMQAQAEATNNTYLAQAESQFRSIEAMNDRYLAGQQLINGMSLEERAHQHAAETGENYEEVLRQITAAYMTDESERSSYLQAQQEIGQAFLDESVDADALLKELTNLHNLYTTGAITHDQYKSSIEGVADNLDDYRDSVEQTIASVGTLNDVLGGGLQGPVMPDFEYEIPTLGPTTEEVEAAKEAMEEAREAAISLAQDGFGAGEQAITDFGDAVRESLEAINALGGDVGGGANDLFDELNERAAEFEERITGLGETGTDALIEIAEAARESRMEFIAAGNALAGWDDALSQLNMTSASTDAMRFAENVQIANSALDNTFRIVVSNTDALGSTVQQTADWADELAYAEDGWTRIHQLQADGFINEQQMNAVFEARTSILDDNWHLQNDIITMQALQAPLLAQMVDQQRQYVHELSNQSAEQQLIALGWMDSATAAQAMEAQTLAATAASGEFGAAGKEAVGNWIEGAVQLNPVLEQMLTDIGLVARDHEGNIVINWDNAEGTMSEIEQLTQSIVTLTDLLDDGSINGSVNFDVNGQEDIDAIIDQVERVSGRRHAVSVDAETSDADFKMQGVADYLTELDGATGTVTAVGVDDASDEILNVDGLRAALDGMTATVTNIGVDNASDEINAVRSNLQDLAGSTATVTINAINNAGSVLGSVAAQLANLDGRTATSYVNTVNTTSFRTVGPTPFALGGTVWADDPGPMGRFGVVPQAANGRSVWVGEYGPELVTLPHGSQVTPHVASVSEAQAGGLGGFRDLVVPIYGNVYGMDDLEERMASALAPVLQDLAQDIHDSQVRIP